MKFGNNFLILTFNYVFFNRMGFIENLYKIKAKYMEFIEIKYNFKKPLLPIYKFFGNLSKHVLFDFFHLCCVQVIFFK